VRFSLFAVVLLLCGGALAQPAAYPTKPVRFIVPYPPGGSADILARSIGAKLAEGLAQPVVVDNRPGAGTAIGTEATAKSPPDGYTVMIGTVSSHAINPSLNPNLKYDPVKDFAPVSLVASIPFVLLAHPSLPAGSVQELVALARAKPGALNFSSAGNGTSNHLAGELLKSMTNVEMVHVPYKGSAPALTDLLAGQVNLMFDLVLTAQPHVRSGAARALGVTGRSRSPALPSVPTIDESGVPGYEVSAWFGIFAPAGTPAAVVKRLNAEIVKIMQLPEMKERLASQGAEAMSSTPEQFAAYVTEELAKWSRVVKASGMKVE
jgi:tripartite-type tricarboxylate transporter receptor subunit TctC